MRSPFFAANGLAIENDSCGFEVAVHDNRSHAILFSSCLTDSAKEACYTELSAVRSEASTFTPGDSLP